MELPEYICHKIVRAAKITRIKQYEDGSWSLIFDDIGVIQDLPKGWISRFKPETGGYYVVYADGYTSFSPAKAFEEGYIKKE